MIRAAAYAALWTLLLVSATFAVTFGPADISPADAWSTVLHHLGLRPESPLTPLRDAIVWDLRLPRTLAALGVGAGLALAGTVMQVMTRNPLADPYLLGLSSGAALGAVIFLLAGAALLMPLGAFLGGLGALALALLVAGLLGGATPSRAILAGISIAALASAATSLLIFWSATGDSYREILSWLMGSLSGTGWGDAGLVALGLIACAPVILFSGRGLDAFAFGDAAASSASTWPACAGRCSPPPRSSPASWSRWAAPSVSSASSCHMPCGLAVGSRHRVLLPATMLVGAIFMLWTDTLARSLFDPRELPVGIVTALVGAPTFLLVLLRYRRIT